MTWCSLFLVTVADAAVRDMTEDLDHDMLFSDAIDRVSTPVPITNGSWLTPGSTLKLHPDRWHFHMEEPAGAVGQVG